jgi:DNA-directed RNA polymerase beta subunit
MLSKGEKSATPYLTPSTMYRNILELYFAQKGNRQIVDHQISSFNHFMTVEVPQTILRACPIRVTGSPDLNLTGTTRAAAGTAGTAIRVSIEGADENTTTKPGGPLLQAATPDVDAPPPREVEVCLEFANIQIRKPTIFENNGAVTPMYPNDARLRNMTYAAPVYTDIIATYTMRTPHKDGSEPEVTIRRRTLPHVHVGKIPVMVGSNYCLLYDTPEKTPRELGECGADVGGYFIIQGGERVIISQERMSENVPFVFRNTKARNKEVEVIDIKSIGPDNEGAPKSMSVKITQHAKNSIAPEHLIVTCPRIKAEIPLFILLRAFGVESDRDIIELICGTVDTPYNMIFQECISVAGAVTTTAAAREWLAANIGSGGGSRESYSANTLQSAKPPRTSTVAEILAEECLPHIGGSDMFYEKACYIAFIAKKVLDVFSGRVPHDDRDAYPNKKVELPGNLMGNLFRYLFGTKVIKDIKTSLTKEIHNGFWKSSGKIEDIINPSNIYKILKSTIVTIGMKSSLATGNFNGGKMGIKAGISQVMNRLTYLSGLSHLRRLSTPIEKTGKLLAPRKLHATQFGFVCPCETPEGHAVGVVKNLSSTALISLPISPEPVVAFLYDRLKMQNLNTVSRKALFEHVRVLVNGAWIGVLAFDPAVAAEAAYAAVEVLRSAKRSGRIHIHTSIIYKSARREIWINTEGGRLMRPVLNARLMREFATDASALPSWLVGSSMTICSTFCWNDVLQWCSPAGHSLIEYIDPSETENFYIALTPETLNADHTHMEIHPCTVLGTMASNIPFPDHNQAPRNSYQCLGVHEEVRMADGSVKQIANVEVGDEVLCFDPTGFRVEPTVVVGQFVRPADKPVYRLEFADGTSLVATSDHQLIGASGSLSLDRDGPHWVTVAELLQGLKSKSGSWVWRFYGSNSVSGPATLVRATHLPDQMMVSDITVASPHSSFITSHGIMSHNCAMGKQALGVYALNHRERLDTMANLLWYSSVPLASPYMSRFYRAQSMPSGFNIVVAIMTYGGYNQEDSIMINRASLDRGLFRSEFYRTYKDEEKKNQASGEEERFCRPNPLTTRHMKLAHYDKLGPDGIVPENTYLNQEDVLIGKVAPIRLRGADGAAMAGINHAALQAMSSVAAAQAVEAAGGKRYRDVSKLMRANEAGYVDRIYRGRNGEGYSFVKIRVREERVPVIGDKFSSRHGQKGTCGLILEPEDMPQTASGIVPDIIINPHCIPSRMTIAQLMETLLGRLGCELGFLGDATPFNTAMTAAGLAEILQNQCGLEPYSNEVLYCGYTGKQMPTNIFMGPCFYQRLKHMVNDKIHSRSTGPLVMLTRQPAEGRARDGGLRFGEMERDVMIAHGATAFLKERMMEASDNFEVHVCKGCGLIGVANKERNIWNCTGCGNTTEFSQVRIPYAYKLFLQELESMNISSRILPETRLRAIADTAAR